MQATISTLIKAGGRETCRPNPPRGAGTRPASADLHAPRLSRVCRRLKAARPATALVGAATNADAEPPRAGSCRAADPASAFLKAMAEHVPERAPLRMDEQVHRLNQCFRVAKRGAMRSIVMASSTPCLRECDLVYDRLLEEDRWWQALRNAQPQDAAVSRESAAPAMPCSLGAAADGEQCSRAAQVPAALQRPVSAPTSSSGQRPLGLLARRPVTAPEQRPQGLGAQQTPDVVARREASDGAATAGAAVGDARAVCGGSCCSKAPRCATLPLQCPPPQLFGPLHPPLSGRGPLQFSSAFESGNLCAVWHASEDPDSVGCQAAYDLLLQPDTLSYGHTQWFFFATELVEDDTSGCRSPKAPVTVSLRILNFRKNESLFEDGLKPAVWDDVRQCWQYDLCQDVSWKPGPLKKLNSCNLGEREPHYALSFSFTFKTRGRVFFACSQPYTSSFLNSCLSQLEACPHRQRYIKRDVLVNTLAGNRVEIVQVADVQVELPRFNLKETAPVSHRRFERNEVGQQEQPPRPVILIIARQHPGEAQGSWMAHGLFQFLTDPEDELAHRLRQRFTFFIVPMLNIDGVIFGNSRCSLSGFDLNRQWVDSGASRDQAPEVWALKAFIAKLPSAPYMCLDLHAHSRKRGIFFYGCRYTEERHYRGQSADVAPQNLQLLPLLTSLGCKLVSWRNCRSSMPMCKRTTARCVLFSKFMIRWVFTIEASVFASVVRTRIHEADPKADVGISTLRLVSNRQLASDDEDDANEDLDEEDGEVLSTPGGDFAQRAARRNCTNSAKEVVPLTPDKLAEFARELGTAILELSDIDLDGSNNVNEELSHRQAELTERCRASGALDEDDSGAGSDNCPSDDNLLLEEREEELAQFRDGEPVDPSMQRPAPRRQPTRAKPSGGLFSPSLRKRKQVSNYGPWLLDGDESSRVPHSWTRMPQYSPMSIWESSAPIGAGGDRVHTPRLAGEPHRSQSRNSAMKRDAGKSIPVYGARGQVLKSCDSSAMPSTMECLARSIIIRGRPQTPRGFRDVMRHQVGHSELQGARRSCSTPRRGSQQLPGQKATLQLPAGWQNFFREYSRGLPSNDVNVVG
mmetsp:Transcript_69358/g.127965  ORF Transcript_69358/g.127965 Transcript_69358/m.127965 type:complete len:1087 (+) Transcript_69358:179-3439(+)